MHFVHDRVSLEDEMKVRVIGKYRTGETGVIIQRLPASNQVKVQIDGATGLGQACFFKTHEVYPLGA